MLFPKKPKITPIPAVYASPTGWIKLKTGTYTDSKMLCGINNIPFECLKFYQAHLQLQRLGVRDIDNMEYNDLISSNPDAAAQTRFYATWTSLLKDVESDTKNGGYTAKHIARPEIVRKDGSLLVKGSEKQIKLPKIGFFSKKHLLQTDDSLPHETFDRPPHEPWAYFNILAGKERPVFRCYWDIHAHDMFYGILSGPKKSVFSHQWYDVQDSHDRFYTPNLWEPDLSIPIVGVRAASDSEPKLGSPKVQLTKTGMLYILDELEDNYTDAHKIEALRAAIEKL